MKPFENIVEEGENARNQHFLLFPHCFLPIPKKISVFKLHLFFRLQKLSIWTNLKICCLVKSETPIFFFQSESHSIVYTNIVFPRYLHYLLNLNGFIDKRKISIPLECTIPKTIVAQT